MVVRIILSDKLYNFSNEREKRDLLSRYLKYLQGLIQGFSNTEVRVRKVRDEDKRVELLIKGPDENFIKNIFRAEVGGTRQFKDLQVGEVLQGTLIDVGKVGFGLFVDCGIIKPTSDVLIPLFTLREQLGAGKRISLNEIVHAYDFIDYFPLVVKVTEINVEDHNIKAEIAPDSLKIFKKIMAENIEGLAICGETKGQFKKALIREGHLHDIITLERYGFLEHLALLTGNTSAPGVIAQIGKYLPGCKFSVLNPKRMSALKED